jgi:hypothetical protein
LVHYDDLSYNNVLDTVQFLFFKRQSKPKSRVHKGSHRPHSRWRRRLLVMAASLVLMVGGGLAIIGLAPGVAANSADSVLRPTIGASATIALEGFFFTLGDKLKQLTASLGSKPSANIFTGPGSAVKPGPIAAPAQLDLRPIKPSGAHSPLAGEGVWSAIDLPQLPGQTAMARTFVRPDPARDYAVVSLVQMDMHRMQLHAVAGTQQPGGPIGAAGPGVIPAADQTGHLIAAFNGGFQYGDGHYGMAVGPKTYVPLLPDLATLTMYQDGKVQIGRYQGKPAGSGAVAAVRQNGSLILETGVVAPETDSGGMLRWGLTTTKTMYT